MQEQSVKLLGEDQRVRTERVSAERRLPEVSQVPHFPQTGALESFTHFLNTADERSDKSLSSKVLLEV